MIARKNGSGAVIGHIEGGDDIIALDIVRARRYGRGRKLGILLDLKLSLYRIVIASCLAFSVIPIDSRFNGLLAFQCTDIQIKGDIVYTIRMEIYSTRIDTDAVQPDTHGNIAVCVISIPVVHAEIDRNFIVLPHLIGSNSQVADGKIVVALTPHRIQGDPGIFRIIGASQIGGGSCRGAFCPAEKIVTASCRDFGTELQRFTVLFDL